MYLAQGPQPQEPALIAVDTRIKEKENKMQNDIHD